MIQRIEKVNRLESKYYRKQRNNRNNEKDNRNNKFDNIFENSINGTANNK